MNKPFVLLCVLISLSLGPALSAQEPTTSPAAFFAGLEQLPHKAIMDSLFSLTNDYTPGHVDSFYYHLLSSKAIERGEATGETIWKAAGMMLKTKLQFVEGDYARSTLTAEAALPLLEQGGFTKRYLDIINIKGVSLLSSGNHTKAIVVYEKGIEYIYQNNLQEEMALQLGRFYYNTGVQKYHSSNYLEALNDALKAKDFLGTSDDIQDKALSSILVGLVKKKFQDTTAWRASLREAGELYLLNGTPIDSLRGIIRLIESAEHLDKAKMRFADGLSLIERLSKDRPLEILQLHTFLLSYTGELYHLMGQPEQQIVLIKQLLALYPDEYIPEFLVIKARTKLAQHYLETGANRKAGNLAERCNREAIRFGDFGNQCAALRILAEANARMGQHRVAFGK